MQNIKVPCVLLRTPERFGGQKDGDCQIGAPIIRNDRLVGLDAPVPDIPVQMVIPALTEAHCHLDKCHTIARLGPVAGDLQTAIAAQLRDKIHWTHEDIHTRATQGLTEARAAGVLTLRSHVDWGDTPEPPLSWHVLCEIAQEHQDVTLQLSPLTGIDKMADGSFTRSLARATADAHGALGAFLHGHDKMREGIFQMIRAAKEYGLPLDFHVDEGLDECNGIEVIADAILEAGFEGPVLCGHAVSLMNRDPEHLKRIADKLARAGIAVCALPTTNLYLQDRREGTPDRRGMTRLRELRASGVPILTASDNVADAFCPLGQFDPMAALHLTALAAHLDPPMARWLPMITIDARRAMGLDPFFIEDAPLRTLRLSDAIDCEGLVAGRSPLRDLKKALDSRNSSTSRFKARWQPL
ncbi:amidohydrolase family protein [Sulfitobacter sp.]|uniref:amidohydrolase family protein n=1 Tax=Sulfitobacter sp. TaxID=1903071 RepID=UPI0030028CB3